MDKGAAGRHEQPEKKFKRAVGRWLGQVEISPAPAPPAEAVSARPRAMTPAEQRELWELRHEVRQLRERYAMLVKIAARASLALLSVASPWLGVKFVEEFIRLVTR